MVAPSREKLIDRINKLMALSQSSHEAEAMLAAERAFKLMASHVISQAELSGQDCSETPQEVSVLIPGGETTRFDVWELLRAVAEAAGCIAYFRKGPARSRRIGQHATLVGFPTEVAAVERLFMALYGVMERDMRAGRAEQVAAEKLDRAAWEAAHAERCVREGWPVPSSFSWPSLRTGMAAYRRGFFGGFTDRVADRLRESRHQHTGGANTGKDLVLVDRAARVTAWAEANIGASSVSIPHGAACSVGWQDGAGAGNRADIGNKQLESYRQLAA